MTCQPLKMDWPAIQAVKKNGAKALPPRGSRGAPRRAGARLVAGRGWSRSRPLIGSNRGQIYFEIPNDADRARCVSLRGRAVHRASAPVDTPSQNPEVARYIPAIIRRSRG